MWFTTKVRYEKTRENGSLKTITEPYLVDALSFTEAEARITNEMMPYTSGAFSVSAVKRSNISEIFWDENGDHFYKAKINLITLDENTGAERKKAIYILVQAFDLNQAAKNLAEGMRGTVSDYEVASSRPRLSMPIKSPRNERAAILRQSSSHAEAAKGVFPHSVENSAQSE